MENLIFLICSFWLSLFIMLAVVIFRLSKLLHGLVSLVDIVKEMSFLYDRLIDVLVMSKDL